MAFPEPLHPAITNKIGLDIAGNFYPLVGLYAWHVAG